MSGGLQASLVAPESRAVLFSLAAHLLGYPAEQFHARLARLRMLAGDLGYFVDGEPHFLDGLMQMPVDDVRSWYLDAFERGRGANPLHETAWGQGQGPGRGNVLADIAAFYRAFGVDMSATAGEMVDHAAVQLEFHALMLLKEARLGAEENAEGVSVVGDARRKFLAEHLAPLAMAAAGDEALVADPLWRDVLAWVRDVVTAECALEKVDARAHVKFGLSPEPDEPECAAAEPPPSSPHLPVLG